MTQTDIEKLKLMVVDDEPDNLELLYRTFRRDFQVYQATNAASAFAILDKEGEMAIIISDQRMPQMNGTEFLSRTVERFPDTIRILLTGFTDVEDLVDAINSGQVFKYITKPWKPDRLKIVVEQAADAYRLVKKRTRELTRALRRESLFNVVTTAIRNSQDYSTMLQKLVAIIGQNFEANYCLLKPVENNSLAAEEFSYLNSTTAFDSSWFDSYTLFVKVVETQQFQQVSYFHEGRWYQQLVVPLAYQQHLLAAIALFQWERTSPCWQDEDIQLLTSVAEQAALALSQAKLYQSLQEKQQQIKAELEVARQIQNNLLRQSWPEIHNAKVQACCCPAREVGGDFFEVFIHPKGDLWIAVGDVSGKGVPAALFMASVISVLRRELSQETPAMPNAVIENLNNALAEDLISNNCFITLVLARYTPSTRELVYANAGHIYPLLWSSGKASKENPHYLKIRGVPLGILPKWQAGFGQLFLPSEEILLLASDGITEAMVVKKTNSSEQANNSIQSEQRSALNLDGLWQLLQQQGRPLCLNHLLARIQADSHVQEDDQTILSLEVL